MQFYIDLKLYIFNEDMNLLIVDEVKYVSCNVMHAFLLFSISVQSVYNDHSKACTRSDCISL